ncbi:MAG: glycosyltransferase [Chlamydiales bacterium]|nr:glycosyltransferase [Chlamydiales bacterium]
MGNQKKKQKAWFESIEEKLLPHHEEGKENVSLSVILPVYNCSEVIDASLASVQKQNYTPLEVIVIDAGSTDRTLEIVNSYASMISRIYTVANFSLPEMLNRGISLATSRYLTFLYPGTTYLSEMAFSFFAKSLAEHHDPDLIYCGSIQRELKREPRTIHQPFDVKLLQTGENPATLPACWFRQELFERFGKFNPRFTLRPGYEFYCRLILEKEVDVVSIDRIFVDFDYGRFSYGKALRFAGETWRTIEAHFGFGKALHWFLTINHLLMLKWLWRKFKETVFQKNR